MENCFLFIPLRDFYALFNKNSHFMYFACFRNIFIKTKLVHVKIYGKF